MNAVHRVCDCMLVAFFEFFTLNDSVVNMHSLPKSPPFPLSRWLS